MPVLNHSPATHRTAAEAVRSLARRLHRAATSDSLSNALPVLRRMVGTRVLRGVSLPQLWQRRGMVQRKHVLSMLAIEAGFPDWETYSHALKTMTEEQVAHFDAHRDQAGHLNLWFSSRRQAEGYASAMGGRVLGWNEQAVVLPWEPNSASSSDQALLRAA